MLMSEPQTSQPLSASVKALALNALEANKAHQRALADRAEKLTVEIQMLDDLLNTIKSCKIGEDDAELGGHVIIPGATKATAPCLPSEFLDLDSPFYEDASRRMFYHSSTTSHPLKGKEPDALKDAVRSENQRLRAIQAQTSGQAMGSADDLENTEGLNWLIIAEKVSQSSNYKRTADQYRVKWLGDMHPKYNHEDWGREELKHLSKLVATQVESCNTVDWDYVSNALGTNRTAFDCMRHGIPREQHRWDRDADEKLLKAVEKHGTDNWGLVATRVSSDVTAAQCQGRYARHLDPTLKKGNWTQQEEARLERAYQAYGNSWIEVATCIPGRNSDQCRDHYNALLSKSISTDFWTEEDDKKLLDAVYNMGTQWTVISATSCKGKSAKQCRLRYDKLKKRKKRQSSVPDTTISRDPGDYAIPTSPSTILTPSSVISPGPSASVVSAPVPVVPPESLSSESSAPPSYLAASDTTPPRPTRSKSWESLISISGPERQVASTPPARSSGVESREHLFDPDRRPASEIAPHPRPQPVAGSSRNRDSLDRMVALDTGSRTASKRKINDTEDEHLTIKRRRTTRATNPLDK